MGEHRGHHGDGVEPHPDHERLDDRLGDGGEQDQEAPEDEGVEQPGVGPAEQPALAEDIHQGGAGAPPQVAAAPVGPP